MQLYFFLKLAVWQRSALMTHASDQKQQKTPYLKAFHIWSCFCWSRASKWQFTAAYRGNHQLTVGCFILCFFFSRTITTSSLAKIFSFRLYCYSILVLLLSSVHLITMSLIPFEIPKICPKMLLTTRVAVQKTSSAWWWCSSFHSRCANHICSAVSCSVGE